MSNPFEYKPNLETHTPHGISKEYYNCAACGDYRAPGKYAGVWACCAKLPCPCCLREQIKIADSMIANLRGRDAK